MKKKLAMITTAVALGAFLVVGGTLAWFSSSTSATNTITTGGVSVQLGETVPKADPEDGEHWSAVKAEDGKGIVYSNIQPGDLIQKDPTITYTGDSEGYVRYKVEVTGKMANGDPLTNEIKNNIILIRNGGTGVNGAPLGEIKASELSEDFTIIEGTMAKDDMYTIFDDVKFSEKLGNEFKGVTGLNIVITVQAVQAANNSENPWENYDNDDAVTIGSTMIVNED